MASEAEYSCQKLRNPLNRTMARIMPASTTSPSAAESSVAATRISVIGVAN
jgi:hypothetical protein